MGICSTYLLLKNFIDENLSCFYRKYRIVNGKKNRFRISRYIYMHNYYNEVLGTIYLWTS